MRHYEVVFLVHPGQSEQVSAMVGRYRAMIKNGGGMIHRFEDWGRRQLSYPVQDLHKAHYILMNIECGQDIIEELEGAFRFNDAVLRSMIMRTGEACTEPSPLARKEEKREEKLPDTEPAPEQEADAETGKPESDNTRTEP